MRRPSNAALGFILLAFLVCSESRCAASENPVLVVRGSKRLMCTARFTETVWGDCGGQSYDSVFAGKITAIREVPGSGQTTVPDRFGAIHPGDLSLTVTTEEVFKGHPAHQTQILAEQGECFADVRAGDTWLFFGERSKRASGLRISYVLSNPSGPIEQRGKYIERLRRLERGDGLSYVVGEVDYPSFDPSKGDLLNPQPNHQLVIRAEASKRDYPLKTDAEGRFELGPVAPGPYQIDVNTNPQFHARPPDVAFASPDPNGCSFVRINLEINSEISGRVILPEGYQYKKSEIQNYFPLFYPDIVTLDGKQVAGTSIGDGLKFSVTGLPPGTYMVKLVNYSGQTWLKKPVYAPGVIDPSTALRIELGLAEHKTGLEIRIPPDALEIAK